MIGANKILTVSYGTFSCTLEGFDDSFATMKEIAEYFRELAAEDRYFGAEPPTPDAEMLTRIAERKVHKRVEAEVQDNNVVLRVEDNSEPELSQVQPLAEPDPILDTAQIHDALPETPTPDAIPDPELDDAETVAEKLSRIRAVVARNQVAADALTDDSSILDESSQLLDTPSIADEYLPMFADPAPQNIYAFEAGAEGFETGYTEYVAEEEAPAELPAQPLPDESEAIELDTDEPAVSFEPDVSTEIASDDLSSPAGFDPSVEVPDSTPRSVKSELFAPLQSVPYEEFDESYEQGAQDLPSALDTTLPEEQHSKKAVRDHHFLSAEDSGESAAMDRLLKEADSQLSNPETSRRRSAISHLRAAVAATVAERKSSPDTADIKPLDEDAYRADLAEVVRPQASPTTNNEPQPKPRPAPSPLMLVSSQRVDHSETEVEDESEEFVQLRDQIREHTTFGLSEADEDHPSTTEDQDEDNIFASDASFANFVTATGANELVDLLEAAAAYTRFVEGIPQFKRPRIMALVTGYAGKDTHSREEGLRAFGILLREGKFEKVKRGYFQISDTTRFRPHSRAAGE